MLDTWFSNNEQEKTSFMSLIDNCVIKKTYNKNDLAKLCDNINFDIRPFINFISKDAVIKDNEREDDNIDYYYELKKIIDALISNKATNNNVNAPEIYNNNDSWWTDLIAENADLYAFAQ